MKERKEKFALLCGSKAEYFDDFEDVEQFIINHPEHLWFSLYFERENVPFKYGYFDSLRRVYCDREHFYKAEKKFIYAPDLFKITVQGETQYAVCHNEDELKAAVFDMVKEFKCQNGNKRCDDVIIATRFKTYRATMLIIAERPTEPELLYEFEDYDREGMAGFFVNPFDGNGAGCWSSCETFEKFMLGYRVKPSELCDMNERECPICDLFYRYLKYTDAKEYEKACGAEGKEEIIRTSALCKYCDFREQTRFEEPCYHCDESIQGQMLRQGQIKFVEEKE